MLTCTAATWSVMTAVAARTRSARWCAGAIPGTAGRHGTCLYRTRIVVTQPTGRGIPSLARQMREPKRAGAGSAGRTGPECIVHRLKQLIDGDLPVTGPVESLAPVGTVAVQGDAHAAHQLVDRHVIIATAVAGA